MGELTVGGWRCAGFIYCYGARVLVQLLPNNTSMDLSNGTEVMLVCMSMVYVSFVQYLYPNSHTNGLLH